MLRNRWQRRRTEALTPVGAGKGVVKGAGQIGKSARSKGAGQDRRRRGQGCGPQSGKGVVKSTGCVLTLGQKVLTVSTAGR